MCEYNTMGILLAGNNDVGAVHDLRLGFINGFDFSSLDFYRKKSQTVSCDNFKSRFQIFSFETSCSVPQLARINGTAKSRFGFRTDRNESFQRISSRRKNKIVLQKH